MIVPILETYTGIVDEGKKKRLVGYPSLTFLTAPM